MTKRAGMTNDMNQTIANVLHQAHKKLEKITTSALLDAELLLANVINKPRSYLYAHPEQMLSIDESELFADDLKRRAALEPLAYIIGFKEFWSLPLSVNRHTLIPRPETELLVEAVLQTLPAEREQCIADLGTGCGPIALALAHERPHWQIVATDICESALSVAQKNAAHLQLLNISFYTGDWCQALPGFSYDAIVSNPPYLSEVEWPTYEKQLGYEPPHALLTGEDGLAALYSIIKTAKTKLKSGGLLFLEHGFNQAALLTEALGDESYENIISLKDFQSLNRVTCARNP